METTQDQSAQGLALVHVLATVLDRLCVANAPMARADPGQVTKFHAMKAPGIGVLQYLERIHKYASCSNECFILALIYIDRLIQRNNFLLTELNVHRVVITAVLLAAKFFDDAYYNNAYYAKVGGVLISEMNGLEVDFLFRINFSLHVTPEVFDKYRAELLSQAATCVTLQNLNVTNNNHMAIEPAPQPQQHHHASHYAQHMVSDTHMVCNPQAPMTHNFAVAPSCPPQQHHMSKVAENPFATSMQQITPPPGPSQVIFGTTTNEASLHFPVALDGHFTQVQRANSCPADASVVYPPSSCSSSMSSQPRPHTTAGQCHSAPAIITPAVHYPNVSSVDVAAMLEQQIFPLQNTLVHHNHHHHHHHLPGSQHAAPTSSNPYAIQPKADPRGQAMLTGGVL